MKDLIKRMKEFVWNENKFPEECEAMAAEIETVKLTPTIEKEILAMYNRDHVNSMRYPHSYNKRVISHWAKNPTHTKKTMIDFLKSGAKTFEWGFPGVFNALVKSGRYTESELSDIADGNRYRYNLYVDAVKEPNFPEKKLRELWEEMWHGYFKNVKEIPQPSWGSFGGRYSDHDSGIVMLTIYNMITESRLAGEFAMSYWEESGDDRFITDEIKELFFF